MDFFSKISKTKELQPLPSRSPPIKILDALLIVLRQENLLRNQWLGTIWDAWIVYGTQYIGKDIHMTFHQSCHPCRWPKLEKYTCLLSKTTHVNIILVMKCFYAIFITETNEHSLNNSDVQITFSLMRQPFEDMRFEQCI